MTNEELFIRLHKIIDWLELPDEERPPYTGWGADVLHATMEHIEELTEARKPVEPTLAIDTWICSRCGHTLESQELIYDKENPQVLVHETYSFCPNCGKAVKWE